ncbi:MULTISPECIES: phenylalanine 4-monooxygenase [unclassified Nocardiopsis]|uniref:phenylalanine 4-monooxygenase n=1 Tax=unclassified Nocardiopsis TaxID=2649073 RepID=UPI00135C8D83|nr:MULTISPECIES: phenylalanine 4-monooxygenase [unclassified Nocardiopsis]
MSDELTQTPVTPDGRLGPAEEHPGFADPDYVRRRDLLAARAEGHRVGAPAPHVDYTESEHETWRTVHRALRRAHEGRVCRAVERAREQAPIPGDRIPQHAEVGDRLRALTGFSFTLAGGIVPNKRFLGAMADGYFHAVQYVRHPAMPLYTPEPDVIHDVFGHGTHLTSLFFADLYRTVGRAAARVDSEDALDLVSRVYWHSLEYGVVREAGGVRAYGAALLSSFGELQRLERAEVRPWDLREIATRPYQVAGYQPVLYLVEDLDRLAEILHDFLDGFDEETGARLGLPPLRERGFMGRPACAPSPG